MAVKYKCMGKRHNPGRRYCRMRYRERVKGNAPPIEYLTVDDALKVAGFKI